MVFALSPAFSLPASAETPADAGGTPPFPLSDVPALFTTITSTEEKEKPVEPPFRQEDAVRLGPEGPTFLDILQAGISKNILQTSQWLDSFFYDPRYVAEANTTRAVVRYEGFIEEHAPLAFKTKVSFVLVLPQLKHRAHIILSGDPNEDNTGRPGQDLLTLPAQQENTGRNTSAAVAYELKSGERRNINAKVGIRYRHGQLVAFIRPHYRRLYQMDGWTLRLTQEVPYWTDTKWSSSTTVDLERPLGEKFFFRTSVNGSWYEMQPGFSYGLVFSLSQPLSTTSALSYDLGAAFQTGARNTQQTVQLSNGKELKSDPGAHDVLQTVVVDTRYRRRFWRDWMYFDITPQVRFPRNRRFNPVPGILFGLEMQFG